MRETHYAILILILLATVSITGLNDITGNYVKSLRKPELSGGEDWVTRRYVCDLPNRNDCYACCDEIQEFARGGAALLDLESCVVKMPPFRTQEAEHVWEDCIHVKAGLQPKYSRTPLTKAPASSLPLAPYTICALLQQKPEQPTLFFPYHPIMIASIIC